MSVGNTDVKADTVEPTERVESLLHVRAKPTANSAVVGELAPGQSASFIGSVPYWYEIELPDGTHGFVSKAWSRVIAQPIAGNAVIRMGSWNIKKLGHGSSKNYPLVASIIDDNFDVLAIVEVMQNGGGHPGYEALLSGLGANWVGVITDTPRPNTSSGNAEFYAVVYRKGHAKLCDGWPGLRYHIDNDGSSGATGKDFFSREPAFGCFVALMPNGSGGFDFLLAPYHARFSEGDIDDIQKEVKHVGEVFDAMAASKPGEYDLMVLGDFNLVPADLDEVLVREIPTAGTGSTLNRQGETTGNLYDHLVLHDATATTEIIGSPEVLDVKNRAANPRTYFDTVSDHLPIRAKFRVGPDDD